jgi:hypothetical protein
VSNTSNPRFNIEVLEPLLLMSASSIDAEPIEVACGGEANDAWIAQAPEDAGVLTESDSDNCWGSDEGYQQDWGFGGGHERGHGIRFGGNRAEYSVEDHGFGIFAIRCGNDNSTDFVADVEKIEFQDGTFSIGELTSDENNKDVASDTVESVTENAAVESLDAEFVELELPAIEWDMTTQDIDGDDIIVTTTADLLTEDVWFPENDGEQEVVVFAESIDGSVVLNEDGNYIDLAEPVMDDCEGWYDMKLDAVNPFSDNVAPHGLWGLTVDADAEARNGDFFKTHGWDYTLQGGGALDTVDATGNVVVSESGDRSANQLYEAANLFSTDALNQGGETFFRFAARQGTGLTRIS